MAAAAEVRKSFAVVVKDKMEVREEVIDIGKEELEEAKELISE